MPLDPVAYQPYADPDDFIREVTDKIWVRRSLAYIRENYEADSIVHGAYGTSTTRQEVIEGSLMRINDTPDRVGQAADVIWEARGDDAFLSSHLVLSGDLILPVMSRTIANCLYRRGRMVEEWVVRDTLAGVRFRGEDPDEVARTTPFRGWSGSFTEPAKPDVVVEGDSGPRADDHRAEVDLVLDLIGRVWNGRDLEAVEEYFDRDLTLHTVGHRTILRPEGYRRALLRFLQAFPGGTFEVRDIQTNDSARYAGLRIAVTWKFTGAYNGRPVYGPTTDTPVTVLGISHFQLHQGRLVGEIKLWDDIAIRSQIAYGRGDHADLVSNIY